MAPAATPVAGPVGTVETQYLDLPTPVQLDCGRELHPVRVAYETYGTVIASTHALHTQGLAWNAIARAPG